MFPPDWVDSECERTVINNLRLPGLVSSKSGFSSDKTNPGFCKDTKISRHDIGGCWGYIYLLQLTSTILITDYSFKSFKSQ